MLTEKTLKDYAELIIKIGVNLQNGQGLEISCPVEKREIAHALTVCAYQNGASIVNVRWTDEILERYHYDYADENILCNLPKWVIECRNHVVKEGFCYVAVSAEDPNAFKGVPAEKLAKVAKAKSLALKKYSDAVMSNGIRWCVVAAPTPAWAKQVFPGSSNAEAQLSTAIEKAMRLDSNDPLSEWEKHIFTLEKHAEFLNYKNFEYLHFKSANGTDLKVGLADKHNWLSAKEKAKDGVSFIANLPTEEVFTAPHKNKVDGVVKSALPLIYNGQTIDKFTLTFKSGKIVDLHAEVGYDALKHLIATDKGTARLGEVALIGKRSPIAKSGILFYNTLFDENASCHLALGKAYPTTLLDGENKTKQELKDLGANDSVEHVDFMIGTDDLTVVGIDKTGNRTVIMENGDWII